jgi:hypothetical protein
VAELMRKEAAMSFSTCRVLLMMVATACFLVGNAAWSQPPEPTDPEGMAMGGLPGTYPTTVTAANVNVEQFTPAELNGANQNNMRVTIPASGPIKWTESRHNEGDMALLISPGMPNDASYFPPADFVDNYAPIAITPFENTTLAWRVNQRTGALLASVRHNGVNYGNDFTVFGSPVGTVRGIAYFNSTGAQGWGFRMSDGVFANGGEGSSDLQMGVAGFNEADFGEANFSTGVAYFPYEQGWIGAWVNGGDEGEATFGSSSMDLPTSTVNWMSSQANVQLPGVNSATDGMLFVAPTHDNNNTNIAAAFPNAGGWTVSVREDDSDVVSGDQSSLLAGDQNGFQFLYVPYSAPGLIGGHVNGVDGSLINSAGDQRFVLTRTSAGEYALSINGPGPARLGENDGMLILSVASSMPGNPTFADRTFLSYEYDSTSGDFLIQSRELTEVGASMPPSEDQFGNVLSLRDSNFYFAWISFTDPLQPDVPGITGDYNDNGTVDAADYVLWRKNLNMSVTLPNDMTPGMVTQDDYTVWRANFGESAGSGTTATVASQTVPEPGSIALVTLLLAVSAVIRVPRSGNGATPYDLYQSRSATARLRLRQLGFIS